MSDIPEKWRINCPLDHSTFEKFVECDCNHGNARDVWWFKEQQLEKLQEQLKEGNEIIAFVCRKLDEAKFDRDHGLKIVTDSILHKEINAYTEKYKVKEKYLKR